MKSKRATLLAIAVPFAVLLALLPASSARAADDTQNAGDDFSVSLPSDPVSLSPGQKSETSLRIANRANETTGFHISGVILETQDEGKVVVTEGSDDWTKSVVVADRVDVPPNEFVDVPIKFTVPASAHADIHLLGFSVAPIRSATGKDVTVKTEAISYLPIDIPGLVHRSLAVHAFKLPHFIFGNTLKGKLQIINNGDAGERFRAQVFLNSATSGKNIGVVQAGDRTSALLLPTGRSRTVNYAWKFKGLFNAIHPKIEASIVGGEANTAAVTQQLPLVVVVQPALVIALGLLLGFVMLVGLSFGIRRIRRRRALRTAA